MFNCASALSVAAIRGAVIAERSDYDRVLIYHDATKHHPQRYARSLGYLDWATQPNPFRRFEGAELVPLVVGSHESEPAYDDLFRVGAIAPQLVNRRSISAFFECSLALSAWKSYQTSTWALRINPSSGNLHPTEGYLLCGPIEGIGDTAGVYHYSPKEHALERRHVIDTDAWRRIVGACDSGLFFVGLSSILWREAWKYGERAFRYCQHDVGHALCCLRLAAAMQGWRLVMLEELGDDDVARVLGLDRDEDFEGAEREEPELLVAVMATGVVPTAADTSSAAGWPSVDTLRDFAEGPWHGRANSLSSDHVEWDIIDMVADITRKPSTGPRPRAQIVSNAPPAAACGEPTAREVILRRRSATDFDGKTSISASQFHAMLARLLPASNGGGAPWDAIGWSPRIHLSMFVHLIDGVSPGLYAFVRDPRRVDALRSAMKRDFSWDKPPGCPDELPLYHLMTADARKAAAQLSLGQAIAGTSAFSFGMIAEFEASLREFGPWFYRRLFWEAGMIGQVLYLEAEAAGLRMENNLRATGIGAYFDDPVHELFGLKDHAFQSMYHFTLGGSVEDTRLTSRPAYDASVRDRS